MNIFLERFNKLSKREKMLILILGFLVIEMAMYFCVFSSKVQSINKIKYEKEMLKSDISTSEGILNNIEELKERNTTMLDEIRLNKIDLPNGSLENLKSLFPNIITQNEGKTLTIDFSTDSKGIKNIKSFSDNYIFNSMQIHKEQDGLYRVNSKIAKEESSTIKPKEVSLIEKVDKNADLKKYLLSRNNSKIESKDSNNINSISRSVKKVNKKLEEKKKIILNKEGKEVLKENISVVNNTQKFTNGLKDDLSFDFSKFILLSNESDTSNIILTDDKNSFMVYYDLYPEMGKDEIYIIFNEIKDYKNLKFKIYVSGDFEGELGAFTSDKLPCNVKIEAGEESEIEFKNLKNFKGLYYKSSGKKVEKGVISLYNFRGSL